MSNANSHPYLRRRGIFSKKPYPWHYDLIPRTLELVGEAAKTEAPDQKPEDGPVLIPHPALTSAVFVVHGIGEQTLSQTAAGLRSAFDDAAELIKNAQLKSGKCTIPEDIVPPSPFISEGFWANYGSAADMFGGAWGYLSYGARQFFRQLMSIRMKEVARTYGWFLKEQLRLIHPRVIRDISFLAWLIYIPLQIVTLVSLTFTLLKMPKILTGYLADVRVYLDPCGATERAVVQAVDVHIAQRFMRVLGLTEDFRALPEEEWSKSLKGPVRFDRVIWVAHSLGTVISYNALGDLFRKADEIEAAHKLKPEEFQEQLDGVKRFRRSLARFVTMGSPLDKAAYLYRTKSVTPWSGHSRADMLPDHGEKTKGCRREWWINYYSVLDPVSGALNSSYLCGDQPPLNVHIGWWHLPGLAHVAYWKDQLPTRFIFSRTYGARSLKDQVPEETHSIVLTFLALIMYLLIAGLAVGIVMALLDGLGICDFGIWAFVGGLMDKAGSFI